MKNTLIVRTDSDEDFLALAEIVRQLIDTVARAGQTDGPISLFNVSGDEPGTDRLRRAVDEIERLVVERAMKNGRAQVIRPGDEDEDGVMRDLPDLAPVVH